jgi:DNA-directed RNA polymerase specialized sigma24 family protein
MPPATPQPRGHDAFDYAQDHLETIRRVISSRIGRRLRRAVDPADIEQSLLRTLLRRPRRAPSEDELRRLVTTIVLNKICTKARKEHCESLTSALAQDPEAVNPADETANREVLGIACQAAGKDWPLVEARVAQGRKFVEMTAEFAAKESALRQRFHRALDRIHDALGGVSHD